MQSTNIPIRSVLHDSTTTPGPLQVQGLISTSTQSVPDDLNTRLAREENDLFQSLGYTPLSNLYQGEFAMIEGYNAEDPIQMDEIGKDAIRAIRAYVPTSQDIIEWHKLLLMRKYQYGWSCSFNLSLFAVNVGTPRHFFPPNQPKVPGEEALMRLDEEYRPIEEAILVACEKYPDETKRAEGLLKLQLSGAGLNGDEIEALNGIPAYLSKLWLLQNPEHPLNPNRKKIFIAAKCSRFIPTGCPFGSVELVEIDLNRAGNWKEAVKILKEQSKLADPQAVLDFVPKPNDLWVYRFADKSGIMLEHPNRYVPLRDERDLYRMLRELKKGEKPSVVIIQQSTMDFQKEVMRKEAEKNKECMAKREAEEAENARAFAEGKIPNEKWSIRIGSLGISEEVHTQAFVDRIIVPESEGDAQAADSENEMSRESRGRRQERHKGRAHEIQELDEAEAPRASTGGLRLKQRRPSKRPQTTSPRRRSSRIAALEAEKSE